MRWHPTTTIPARDVLVLIWHNDTPRLARRVKSKHVWFWEIECELGECPISDGGWSERVPPGDVTHWAEIPSPNART